MRSFGPESPSPRERRAYAHAMIAEADPDELGSVEAAIVAVQRTGTNRKSLESGLDSAVTNLLDRVHERSERANALSELSREPLHVVFTRMGEEFKGMYFNRHSPYEVPYAAEIVGVSVDSESGTVGLALSAGNDDIRIVEVDGSTRNMKPDAHGGRFAFVDSVYEAGDIWFATGEYGEFDFGITEEPHAPQLVRAAA